MTEPAAGPGSAPARRSGGRLAVAWLRRAAAAVHDQRAWLTELDAAIGDGDHGINLDRGFQALLADLEARTGADDDDGLLLVAAGRRLLAQVGGASGALYGRAMMLAGERVRARERDVDGGAAHEEPRLVATAILAGAVEAVEALGHARPGEKTMLDALVPALDALRAVPAEAPAGDALQAAAAAAEAGARGTIPLIARKGRASYLGERSANHLDPGAASAAILVRCLADAVADEGMGDR